MNETNSSVGSYEAKTHLPALLDRVLSGEEITITRHGVPVARLVPAQTRSSVRARCEAIQKMRELAGRHRLEGLSIRNLIDEGRR